MSISSWGHLYFLSADNLVDYMLFVKSRTHRQVFAYLDSIGFESLASTKYSGGILDNQITERQAIDYVLDVNGILQVANAVMRPIEETVSGDLSHEFVLVIRADNLNSTSHETLVAGEYDGEVMNQFATYPHDNPESIGNGDLLELIAEDPFGIQETETNAWPDDWDHPIFGYGSIPAGGNCSEWQETDPGCNCLVWRHKIIEKGKKYFLGIKVKDFQYVINYGNCPS